MKLKIDAKIVFREEKKRIFLLKNVYPPYNDATINPTNPIIATGFIILLNLLNAIFPPIFLKRID